MAFSDTQIRQLKLKPKAGHVKTREADGVKLHYLEGWHVVTEANRIFGFDGWDRETMSSSCVWTKQTGNRYRAAYVARVKITVRAGNERIIREGHGVGESNAASPGEAHEFAVKAAETDATKRALSTFGNPFGLSLYGTGAETSKNEKRPLRNEPQGHIAQDQQTLPGQENPRSAGLLQVPPSNLGQAWEAGDVASTPASITAACLPTELFVGQVETFDMAPAETTAATFQAEVIDKSELVIAEPKRLRDASHLRFVAAQPCLICGRQPSQAHHLKFTQFKALSRKVSDEFTVPLCATHHRQLHGFGNERSWWEGRRLDPEPVALKLWEQSHGSA